MSTRTLIVDDHPIIRSTVVSSLSALRIFDEVDSAASFEELLEKLASGAVYQLLILDLSLTDISGSKGVAFIREHYPDIPVLIFSGSDSTDIIAECIEYGVQGFVSKAASMQSLVNAIRTVLSGNIYIPAGAARVMGFDPPEERDPNVEPQQEQVRFTPRQQLVFEQLMLGMPNKIIARRLDMAEGTVKTHLHGIYQLLRVNSRAQAILKSRQIQIV
jgi:DNA-binding NarL/FixJ family response regulator